MLLDEILNDVPNNPTIVNSIIKAYGKINSPRYNNIQCSISGGADSDVVLDICTKCDNDHKIDYYYFDTGLEYEATKEHLKYLENKYGIEIKVEKAIKSIPICCKEYGEPFLSKNISKILESLQRHNFDFSKGDRSFDELYKEYPRCKYVLQCWCNIEGPRNINRNSWLKEFLILNPPEFKITDKCCEYAKKKVVKNVIKSGNYELNIMGVRKAEGGTRASAYSSCFSETDTGVDYYRPLFWYKNSDKNEYVDYYDIIHSDCYTKYGLKRTGCAGCPFGRHFEDELKIIEEHEPKLYKAVNNIFANSYAYRRKYDAFKKEMNEKYGSYAAYLRLKDK